MGWQRKYGSARSGEFGGGHDRPTQRLFPVAVVVRGVHEAAQPMDGHGSGEHDDRQKAAMV
jgi:hypothetical protein